VGSKQRSLPTSLYVGFILKILNRKQVFMIQFFILTKSFKKGYCTN